MIASDFNIPAISTGEIFRQESRAGTEIGRRAAGLIANGELVPDDIVNRIVVARIRRPDCERGVLLDGYPRTVPQAIFLDDFLRRRGWPPAIVIHLDVPHDVLVQRLCARRQCPSCQRIYNLLSQPPRRDGVCDADGTSLERRADDREDVIRQRLHAYDEQTAPVLQHFCKRQCHHIDGARTPEKIHDSIRAILEKRAVPVAAV